MVHAQPAIRPEEYEARNSLEFGESNGSPNLGQMTRPIDSQQRKKNLPNSRLYCLHWFGMIATYKGPIYGLYRTKLHTYAKLNCLS